MLRARIYDKFMQEEMEKMGAERKSKVGTGDRSERIRTYNYPQSRVTDHRIGLTLHRLDSVLNGDMEEIISALTIASQTDQLDKGESA
ncbi:Peptide chain release factor 1 [compost metagenome]